MKYIVDLSDIDKLEELTRLKIEIDGFSLLDHLLNQVQGVEARLLLVSEEIEHEFLNLPEVVNNNVKLIALSNEQRDSRITWDSSNLEVEVEQFIANLEQLLGHEIEAACALNPRYIIRNHELSVTEIVSNYIVCANNQPLLFTYRTGLGEYQRYQVSDVELINISNIKELIAIDHQLLNNPRYVVELYQYLTTRNTQAALLDYFDCERISNLESICLIIEYSIIMLDFDRLSEILNSPNIRVWLQHYQRKMDDKFLLLNELLRNQNKFYQTPADITCTSEYSWQLSQPDLALYIESSLDKFLSKSLLVEQYVDLYLLKRAVSTSECQSIDLEPLIRKGLANNYSRVSKTVICNQILNQAIQPNQAVKTLVIDYIKSLYSCNPRLAAELLGITESPSVKAINYIVKGNFNLEIEQQIAEFYKLYEIPQEQPVTVQMWKEINTNPLTEYQAMDPIGELIDIQNEPTLFRRKNLEMLFPKMADCLFSSNQTIASDLEFVQTNRDWIQVYDKSLLNGYSNHRLLSKIIESINLTNGAGMQEVICVCDIGKRPSRIVNLEPYKTFVDDHTIIVADQNIDLINQDLMIINRRCLKKLSAYLRASLHSEAVLKSLDQKQVSAGLEDFIKTEKINIIELNLDLSFKQQNLNLPEPTIDQLIDVESETCDAVYYSQAINKIKDHLLSNQNSINHLLSATIEKIAVVDNGYDFLIDISELESFDQDNIKVLAEFYPFHQTDVRKYVTGVEFIKLDQRLFIKKNFSHLSLAENGKWRLLVRLLGDNPCDIRIEISSDCEVPINMEVKAVPDFELKVY